MALSVASGSFNIGTGAAGTTATISPGFETKALILWWSGRTESTDAFGSATSLKGMGFAVSDSSFQCCATRDQDAAGTSVTSMGQRDDACILELGVDVAAGWADVQSISSTDVVFEVIDPFTTDLRVSYLALGGSDITAAEVGNFLAAGVAPTNQIVPTTNEGKAIFFLTTRLGTVIPTAGANASIMFGAATSSASEYVLSNNTDDGATTGDTAAYCLAGECIATISGTLTTCDTRAEFVSFNATPSFTINWIERSVAPRVMYLQLSGTNLNVALGDFQTLNTTGTITETGLAFQPSALMVMSANVAAHTADTPTAHDEWSVGVATASHRMVQQSSSRDGNTTMFVQTGIQYDEVYLNADPATDAIEGSADWQAFTSDGFTLDMDDADPAAAFAGYIALGNPPAAGRTTKNIRAFPLGQDLGMGVGMGGIQ
jgi:hypothetical protein